MQINKMNIQDLKESRNLVGENPPSAIVIVLQVLFLNALNYGYSLTFRKTLDHPESYMRYTFIHNKMCTKEVF